MAPTLHGYDLSPPVRSTLFTLKALGVEFNHIPVSVTDKQNLTPEFLKLNPLQTVPTLEDEDGFVVFDSHAINAYLADKYSQGDSVLYPKDIRKRATINQRMFFDCGALFPRFFDAVYELKGGAKMVSTSIVEKTINAYSSLETLLEKGPYVAGEELSLADFSLITTVTSSNVIVPLAPNKYPNITKWIEKMRELPYYQECNQDGLDKMVEVIRNF